VAPWRFPALLTQAGGSHHSGAARVEAGGSWVSSPRLHAVEIESLHAAALPTRSTDMLGRDKLERFLERNRGSCAAGIHAGRNPERFIRHTGRSIKTPTSEQMKMFLTRLGSTLKAVHYRDDHAD